MRIVKRFVVASIVLGIILIFMVCSAFAEARLFDCDTESCTYDGNTSKWNCQYLNCPVMPSWINQTNITYVNTTQVNVSNCNITTMEEYWDSYVGRIDKRFNFSVDLETCQDSLRSCRNELGTASTLMQGMVNQTLLYQCQTDATAARKQAQDEANGSWYRLLIGLALGAGGAWYFMKKPESERTKMMTTPGEVAYNPRAISQDARIAEQESEIGKLKQMINERVLGKPAVQPAKPGKQKPKSVTPNPFGDDEEGR